MFQRMTGSVKWFDMSKGYGYIEIGNGEEVFVYYQNIVDKGLKNLIAGDRVEFAVSHKPSGMVVSCESERSQTQNKLRAMNILRARLYEIERRKQSDELDATRRSQVGSGDRSEKIRTYNFPQNRVTDHRIGLALYRLPVILEGDLDEFIDALSTHQQTAQLETL